MAGYPIVSTSGWLALIILQLLLPLSLFGGVPMITLLKHVFRRKSTTAHPDSNQERRAVKRIQGENLLAIVTDKRGRTLGKVKDVSIDGICITKFTDDLHKVESDVIFSGIGNRTFSLSIKPCWQQIQKANMLIGASIIKSPAGWPEYIATAI